MHLGEKKSPTQLISLEKKTSSQNVAKPSPEVSLLRISQLPLHAIKLTTTQNAIAFDKDTHTHASAKLKRQSNTLFFLKGNGKADSDGEQAAADLEHRRRVV